MKINMKMKKILIKSLIEIMSMINILSMLSIMIDLYSE